MTLQQCRGDLTQHLAAGEDRFPPRTFQIRELQAVLIKPLVLS
jgi:hypothetical protein